MLGPAGLLVVGALVGVGCGGAEPLKVTAPAASGPANISQAGAASPPLTAAACTLTRALSPSCSPCVQARCCAPPVLFAGRTAQALGCRMGCRKPLPIGAPPPPRDERAAAIEACLATCDEVFPDPSQQAPRMDACIAGQCASQCLGGA